MDGKWIVFCEQTLICINKHWVAKSQRVSPSLSHVHTIYWLHPTVTKKPEHNRKLTQQHVTGQT